MAAKNETLINGVQLTASAVALYTSPVNGAGTRVVAFTATNDSVGTETYTLHVVPSGGSADSTNILVKAKSLTASEDDEPVAIINHLIPPGGTIEVLASTTLTIAVRASGIEFT